MNQRQIYVSQKPWWADQIYKNCLSFSPKPRMFSGDQDVIMWNSAYKYKKTQIQMWFLKCVYMKSETLQTSHVLCNIKERVALREAKKNRFLLCCANSFDGLFKLELFRRCLKHEKASATLVCLCFFNRWLRICDNSSEMDDGNIGRWSFRADVKLKIICCVTELSRLNPS